MEKEEYAIVSKEGYFMTAPNEIGGGRYISLVTKKQAELFIKMYCKTTHKIKKMKVL